jgi:hypothetical protein
MHRAVGKYVATLLDEAETIAALDRTFEGLAKADGDEFAAMDSLGEALTNESRVIERLVLTDRAEQAPSHVVLGLDRLAPLERAFDKALADFRRIESAQGQYRMRNAFNS